MAKPTSSENISEQLEVVEPITDAELAAQLVDGDDNPGHGKHLIAGAALAVALVGGVTAAAGTERVGHDIQTGYQKAMQGITFVPGVSRGGSQLLIEIDDGLRSGAPYALGALGLGELYIRRRRTTDPQFRETYEFVKDTTTGNNDPSILWKLAPERFTPPAKKAKRETGSLAAKISSSVIIAAVAAGSGVGDTASKGANQPVRVLESATGANSASAPIIAQEPYYTPFNHGSVKESTLQSLQLRLKAEGGKLVPVTAVLGRAINPDAKANPSSAPIVGVPSANIKQAFGLEMPVPKGSEDCEDFSVIVGKQLGAVAGQKILVEGIQARVAKVIDSYPGLDRVGVIGSIEQMRKCILQGEEPNMAIVLGMDGKQAEIQQLLKEMGSSYDVQDFGEMQKAYTEFWDRSVKPPITEGLLELLIAGAGGVFFVRMSEAQRNRKRLASMQIDNDPIKPIKNSETLRAFEDVKHATIRSIPYAFILTAAANSSQFGVNEAFGLRSLGAGALAYGVVSGIGRLGAGAFIKRMDPVEEIRSDA